MPLNKDSRNETLICLFHWKLLFFVLSASLILRRVLWRALTWSGRSPPCWAWWWRGWSRAPMGATPPNPTAAPAPAMRYKRRPWGGGVPADDATRQSSTATETRSRLESCKRNHTVITAWSHMIVFAACCYLFTYAMSSEKDSQRLYFFFKDSNVILHIHINMHTQMGHIREKYHFYLTHWWKKNAGTSCIFIMNYYQKHWRHGYISSMDDHFC